MRSFFRSSALFFILSLLVACSGGGGGNSFRAKKLRSIGYDAVPLQAAKGYDSRVGVDALVNNTPVSLLIDSGANASRVSEAVSKVAQLERRKGTSAISRGALGRPIRIFQGIGSLTVGELIVAPYLFSIGDGTKGPTAIGKFDGHIGSDGLGLMSGLVDVGSGYIWLPNSNAKNVSRGTIGPLGYQEGLGLIAKKFSLAKDSAHFVIETAVNGKRATWVIDTGAEISLITRQSARRLGIRSRPSRVKILDAHGDRASVSVGMVPEIKFGGFTAVGLQVGVSNLPSLGKFFKDSKGRSIDGILGIDFLRQTDALLDAKSHILYIGNR